MSCKKRLFRPPQIFFVFPLIFKIELKTLQKNNENQAKIFKIIQIIVASDAVTIEIQKKSFSGRENLTS